MYGAYQWKSRTGELASIRAQAANATIALTILRNGQFLSLQGTAMPELLSLVATTRHMAIGVIARKNSVTLVKAIFNGARRGHAQQFS